jgi:hypothetical protein
MPVESAADRAAFFSSQDFGVSATYSRGGTPSTVTGIFDREYVSADVAEVPFASTEPVFSLRSADVPSGAIPGDTLTISGTAFVVRNIEPDGTGVTRLRLESPT